MFSDFRIIRDPGSLFVERYRLGLYDINIGAYVIRV